jgi:hypothetical protein
MLEKWGSEAYSYEPKDDSRESKQNGSEYDRVKHVACNKGALDDQVQP